MTETANHLCQMEAEVPYSMYQISWQSTKYLLRYLGLDQNSGPTNRWTLPSIEPCHIGWLEKLQWFHVFLNIFFFIGFWLWNLLSSTKEHHKEPPVKTKEVTDIQILLYNCLVGSRHKLSKIILCFCANNYDLFNS